ncbi:uncharacterized protein C2845_PM05G20130 [Panicum miliaceum]|uniref:Uncharacterized protein n=1 Tax=Panicum miliaceum TaxID=4540 RepID=A0A3L6SUY5_PANMI|nr:uncharacterized protein C2845_PM05G20130 [Panicum miliaceum]
MVGRDRGIMRSLTDVIGRVSGRAESPRTTRERRGRRASSAVAEDSGMARGRRGKRVTRRRSPSPVATSSSSEEKEEEREEQEEEQENQAKEVEDEEEAEEEVGAEEGTTPVVWLRGPSRLPERPIPFERRLIIRPDGKRNFVMIALGAHSRIPNGILGLLCKLHFPGAMQISGRLQLAYSWDHYIACADAPSWEGRIFPNRVQRVLNELWDFYRCEEGMLPTALEVANKACYKLVADMHHETRIQAVITYKARYEQVKVKKEDKWQVPPWWIAKDT